jgi:hypothetical protein
MGKLIDNLPNVYNDGVVSISDAVESLDVNMELQHLEPAAAESKVVLDFSNLGSCYV